MVFHMKTTLVIDDTVLDRVREEATKRGRTISELVETALRDFLTRKPETRPLPPLPVWDGGGLLVDVANREELDEILGDD